MNEAKIIIAVWLVLVVLIESIIFLATSPIIVLVSLATILASVAPCMLLWLLLLSE